MNYYNGVTIDGTYYNAEIDIQWLRLGFKNLNRFLFIGYIYSSTDENIWNKYISTNKILVTKSIDSEFTNFTSIDGVGGLVNSINFYGLSLFHNCNGASHHIGFRGTLSAELKKGTKYTATIPEWCIANGGGSLVVFNGYTAMVIINEETLEFTPTETIPSGTWLIGSCTIINY